MAFQISGFRVHPLLLPDRKHCEWGDGILGLPRPHASATAMFELRVLPAVIHRLADEAQRDERSFPLYLKRPPTPQEAVPSQEEATVEATETRAPPEQRHDRQAR